MAAACTVCQLFPTCFFLRVSNRVAYSVLLSNHTHYPKIHRITWRRVEEAVVSLHPDRPFVDDYQRDEFSRHGVTSRSIPFRTKVSVRALAGWTRPSFHFSN